MTVQQHIQSDDRVVSALIAGLELEFGHRAADALAHRFLEAEAADFHWDARQQERWIGSYDSVDDEDCELDRVAILGWLEGCWFVAICIIDGEGQAHGLSGKRCFGTRDDAERALGDVR
jgi:hypothetical protein